MWVIKSVLVSENRNIVRSTNCKTLDEAVVEKNDQIRIAYDYIVDDSESYCLGQGLDIIVNNLQGDDEAEFLHEMILLTCKLTNKFLKPKIELSFTIEMNEMNEIKEEISEIGKYETLFNSYYDFVNRLYSKGIIDEDYIDRFCADDVRIKVFDPYN